MVTARYSTDVNGSGRNVRVFLSLLLGAALSVLSGCGESSLPGKPELPQSVSPGWSRTSFEHVPAPAGLPAGTKTDCWKAAYSGKGAAEVWTCGFSSNGGAFDAVQRTRAEADTVKFQQGKYLMIVKWTGGSKEEVTALVRAVQKSLASQSS